MARGAVGAEGAEGAASAEGACRHGRRLHRSWEVQNPPTFEKWGGQEGSKVGGTGRSNVEATGGQRWRRQGKAKVEETGDNLIS